MYENIIVLWIFRIYEANKRKTKKRILTTEVKNKLRFGGKILANIQGNKESRDYSPHRTHRKWTGVDEWVWQMCFIFLPMSHWHLRDSWTLISQIMYWPKLKGRCRWQRESSNGYCIIRICDFPKKIQQICCMLQKHIFHFSCCKFITLHFHWMFPCPWCWLNQSALCASH